MAGSSIKRDFLAEYEAEQAILLHYEAEQRNYNTAAIGAKRPRLKRAEEAAVEEFGELLTRTVGEEQAKFLADVDVHVGEAGISYAKEKANGPRAVLSDLTVIVSAYHLIGYYMQIPVYNAAQPDGTSIEVCIFYFWWGW